MPRKIEPIKWDYLGSTRNFLFVVWYIIFVNLIDLSNFFNKFVLDIPADHPMLICRVFFWGFLAIAATREYHEYMIS